MAEYLWLSSLIECICTGVTGENYSGARTNISSYPRSESMTPATTVLVILQNGHHLSRRICRSKAYIIFVWVIKMISDCWWFLIKILFYSATALYHMWILRYSQRHLNDFSFLLTNFCFDLSGQIWILFWI